MWCDLLNLKQSKLASWIVLSDFNDVRRPEERINSVFYKSSTKSFNRFIQRAELHDLKMGGSRFTYYQQFGAKLSKLDRFLVCSKFRDKFPLASSISLPKELSDNSSVILKTEVDDFGPPPFKMFNSWMLREGFDQVVLKAWEEFKGFGVADTFLACKLKHLNGEINKWKAIEFQKENQKLLNTK